MTASERNAVSGGAGTDAPLPKGPPQGHTRRTVLYVLALVGLLALVVHPLRHHVLGPRRQRLLGYRLAPGRRLSVASEFGFRTASGSSFQVVPGRPALEPGDLPSQALTLILGGFRGPYVVWLWIKVEDEKQKKAHFDLIDRYAKIAALQSQYSQVWAFHIWNLAWNVSVQWQSPHRKYRWIRAAIELAREGYRKDPRSAEIMMVVGRIYSEKFGLSQEAPYYRERVEQEEGRSTFLIAYEWYDRARKAHDRYGTSLGYALSKPVNYRQACHNLTYYARELSAEAYDALKESRAARQAGRTKQSREAFQRGLRILDEAVSVWEWARRDWHDQAVRFEKEGLPPGQREVYKRFYDEADRARKYFQHLASRLTYENLPELFPEMLRLELRRPMPVPAR